MKLMRAFSSFRHSAYKSTIRERGLAFKNVVHRSSRNSPTIDRSVTEAGQMPAHSQY